MTAGAGDGSAGSGNITLQVTGGNLIIGDGLPSAFPGMADIAASGDGGAGGLISLLTNQTVTDNDLQGGFDLSFPRVNVLGNGLLITAPAASTNPTTVGTFVNPLETAVNQLDGNLATGGVFVIENFSGGTLTLTNLDATAGSVSSTVGAAVDGSLTVTNHSLVIAANVTAVTPVLLTAGETNDPA